MPRDINDDGPYRLSAAEQALHDEERRKLLDLTRTVRDIESQLARAKTLTRVRNTTFFVALALLIGAGAWSVAVWEPSRFLKPDIICGALALIALISAFLANNALPVDSSLDEMDGNLDQHRDELRFLSALVRPGLAEQRALYREDVQALIENYQQDSRKYRRTHNSLQNLVMVGSACTTTIAALDAKEPTWQNLAVLSISFAITVASMINGYYKFRERSYFLQQTADAIEEEANAVTLGVGEYSEFTPGQEQQALARFTQRVEALRNEQRRRQQQLDQPADQAPPTGPPPA
ncbi:SLATT domain-containing protein [Streptomyces sp. LARHCF249]